jgi:glycosyltransferase involved in cell wall biosynthesis
MKILQINKFLYPKGGSESYMFELSKALVDLGHDVEFWGMKDEKNSVKDTYNSFVQNIDFSTLRGIEKLSKAFTTVYSRESKRKISIVLDAFQPDIVHIHNFNFQLTPSILPEIKKRGIKVIYTAHDSQLVCPYHRLYNFQKDEVCTKCIDGAFSNCITDRCFDGSLLKSTLGSLESYLYHGLDYYNKYIDKVISPSQFLADKISHLYDNKIEVVPNFVELQLEKNISKDEYILYFGRVSKEKGIIDILPFFEKHKMKLKIIGNGPEVDSIITSQYIEYLGPKYSDELFPYIQQAKFVIQPSKWYENCPMTIIESFACATPVIGSKHSGFLELIEDEKNGFLIDFTVEKSLLHKNLLDSIMNYDEKFSQYSRSSYETYFTKEVHIPKIISIYKKVLNESI